MLGQNLEDLAIAAAQYGLALHSGKTKILSNKHDRTAAEQQKHIIVLDNNIKVCENHYTKFKDESYDANIDKHLILLDDSDSEMKRF